MTGRSAQFGHRAVPSLVTAAGLAAALALAACGSPREEAAPGSAPSEAVPARPTLDEAGRPVGLEHYRRWSDRLAQGGQPQGEVAFANLAALGFRTVVSVDGARPDAETAARHGLRYVHVPFGYDGVPPDAQARIVKAVAASDGPVYVHCHHGLHRGPAGAMFARMALEGISPDEAVRELKESGCSEKYEGLYRDVAAAKPPTERDLAALPAELPSYVAPGDLAEHMAALSRTWERIDLVKAAGWRQPPDHPDIDPPHEARMLWENLRESARLDASRAQGEEFMALLAAAEKGGEALEAALRAGDAAAAARAQGEIKRSCDACHKAYRD